MHRLTASVFFLALFTVFLLPPTDPDLGWHLRCGQEIWQGQGFCEQNQFSVLLENYSWPNHAWGYQALIQPIWSAFGGWGLTVFNTLLMAAAFGFLYLAIKNFRLEKMLLILLTIYLGWGVFSFGIRSQLLGFFFFNLVLYLLTKVERNPRLTFILPLIMLLWANTHGSVILGLILIGVFSLTTIVVKRERILLFAVATATSGLVTLVNPFGFRIYEEMWRHFAGPIDLSKLIAEWVPPQPHIQQIILISGAAVFVYILLQSLRSSAIHCALPTLFLIPIFAFWALQARRNVPFYFSLVSFLFLTSAKTREVLDSWLKDRAYQNFLAGLVAVMLLIYGLAVRVPQTVEANSSWQSYVQTLPVGPPMEAIEFLKNQPEEERGPIFNRYEIGGFLIWQLPEYKIFVDGRMPAWVGAENKSPYTIYLETLQARPGWQETLDTYNIDWILVSPGNYLDLLLHPDPQKFGWQEAFRDKASVVYKRL